MFGTGVPVTIFINILAFLHTIKKIMRGPSKILLLVSIITFMPFMLFILIRAKTSFKRI
jgi:hypothetical protein